MVCENFSIFKITMGCTDPTSFLFANVFHVINWLLIVSPLIPVPALRDLYYRESRDGLYGPTTFLLAYFFHMLPFTVASVSIFCSVVYW